MTRYALISELRQTTNLAWRYYGSSCGFGNLDTNITDKFYVKLIYYLWLKYNSYSLIQMYTQGAIQ